MSQHLAPPTHRTTIALRFMLAAVIIMWLCVVASAALGAFSWWQLASSVVITGACSVIWAKRHTG